MLSEKDLPVIIRPIDEADAGYVVAWRNSKEARAGFFTVCVVTPDSHVAFVRKRKPHDLVWIIEKKPDMEHNAEPIGMVSLTVDVANYKAEFGRLFIDNLHRRLGYGEVATYIVLYYAFEVLRLNYVWADVKINNISAVAFYEKVGFIKQEDKESVHENAVIYEYYRMQWQQVGRVQFGELLKMELPQWEA